jgi:hypothetical protein
MSVAIDGTPFEIRDDDMLYRRFLPRHMKRGRVPPTAFTKPRTTEPDPEISVNLACITTATDMMQDQPTSLRLAVISVRDVRILGFQIIPDSQEGDPGHCLILGVQSMDDCDRLAEKAQVYVPPSTDQAAAPPQVRSEEPEPPTD